MPSQRHALLAIALVLLVALGLTLSEIFGVEELKPEPVVVAPSRPPVAPTPRREANARELAPTAVASGAEQPAVDPRNRVRGQVDVALGLVFPAQFEIVVAGAAGAPQAHVFSGPERLVTLDLGAGRWQLFARSEGLASHQLLLERSDAAPTAPFKLVLEAAGRVGGQVLDARGAPLAELPVWLVATSSKDQRRVNAGSDGRYVFADIPVGAYKLSFGSSDSPIAPVVPVTIVASEVGDIPPASMPDLGEGEIRVVDRAGQPVVGARVFGAGQHGGWIEGFSDASGSVKARFLPEGTFFLDVTTPTNLTGQGPLEIHSGRIGRAVVQVR